MSREYIVALTESLEKKIKVLDEIQRIIKFQTELLAQEELDYEAFDSYMDDRDICLDKLDKLDEGFELVYERVANELKDNKSEYADLIKKMQGLIKEITDKTTAIAAADKRNKSSVENAFIKDKRRVAEGRRSVSVAMNYYKNMSAAVSSGGQYMDDKK